MASRLLRHRSIRSFSGSRNECGRCCNAEPTGHLRVGVIIKAEKSVGMVIQAESKNWQAQATFVFRGVVVELKDRTAVVRVVEAIRAPEFLEQYVGSHITVRLSRNEKLSVSEPAVFYTHSVTVGETLVVQSLGHVPDTGTVPHDDVVDPALRAQLAKADIVITGKVTSVRPVPSVPSRPSGGAKVLPPISEHDPKWREATISVTRVESGGQTPPEIVVRFPSSTDVLWSKAPKLHPGQQAVFLLNRVDTGKSPARKTRTYQALALADVQPIQKVETIRSIMRSRKS